MRACCFVHLISFKTWKVCKVHVIVVLTPAASHLPMCLSARWWTCSFERTQKNKIKIKQSTKRFKRSKKTNIKLNQNTNQVHKKAIVKTIMVITINKTKKALTSMMDTTVSRRLSLSVCVHNTSSLFLSIFLSQGYEAVWHVCSQLYFPPWKIISKKKGRWKKKKTISRILFYLFIYFGLFIFLLVTNSYQGMLYRWVENFFMITSIYYSQFTFYYPLYIELWNSICSWGLYFPPLNTIYSFWVLVWFSNRSWP